MALSFSLWSGRCSMRTIRTIWWVIRHWCSLSLDRSLRQDKLWPNSSASGYAHQNSSSLWVHMTGCILRLHMICIYGYIAWMWLVLCDIFSLSLYVMLCWAESWKSNSRAHCPVCWGTSYPGLKDWECSMSKLFTMGKTSIHFNDNSQTVFCNTNTYNFYNYNFEITFIFHTFSDIADQASMCLTEIVVPKRSGPQKLLATLDCPQLTQVHGVANILVKDHWIIFTSLISANVYILKTLTTALWLQYFSMRAKCVWPNLRNKHDAFRSTYSS